MPSWELNLMDPTESYMFFPFVSNTPTEFFVSFFFWFTMVSVELDPIALKHISSSSNIYIQERLEENRCLFHLSWYLTFGKNLKSRKDPQGKGGCKKHQVKKTIGCEKVSTMKHKVMDPTKGLKTKLVTKGLPQ